jgi:predicted  nucleic acid-binding Zn-ribbon protein
MSDDGHIAPPAGRVSVLQAQQEQQQTTLAALAKQSPADAQWTALGDASYRRNGGALAEVSVQPQQVGIDGLAVAMRQQQEILSQALGALASNGASVGTAVGAQQKVLTEGVFGELDDLRAALEEVRAESRAAAASSVDREVMVSLVQELHAFKETTNQELAQLRTENANLRSRLGTADERATQLERHRETLLAQAIAEATLTINRDVAELSRRIGDVDSQERKMEERLVGVMADAKSGREILGSELQTLRGECERLRDTLSRAEERVDSTQRDASKLQFDVDAFKKNLTQSELPRLSTAIEHKAEADVVDVLEVQMKDCRSTIADLATKLAGVSGRERPSPQPKSSPRDLEAEIQRRSQAILSDFGSRGWDSFTPGSRERSASQPPPVSAAAAVSGEVVGSGLKHAASAARSHIAERAEEGIPEIHEDEEEGAAAGAAGPSKQSLSPRTSALAASVAAKASLADQPEEGGSKELFGGGSAAGDDMYAGVRADGD